MPGKIALKNFDEFQKRCQDLENIGDDIRQALGTYVPKAAEDIWNPSNALQRASSRLDRAALNGARVRASAVSVTLTGATDPKVKVPWYAVEFGASGEKVTTYSRRTKHGSTSVTRHTQKQLPPRHAKGRVLYPAGKEALHRFSKLIGATVVKTIYERLEGK